MRFVTGIALSLMLVAGTVILPGTARAQATCEAAAVMAPAVAAAPAFGMLGERIEGGFAKIDNVMDQAAAGTVGDSDAAQAAVTPVPTVEANMPVPVPVGC